MEILIIIVWLTILAAIYLETGVILVALMAAISSMSGGTSGPKWSAVWKWPTLFSGKTLLGLIFVWALLVPNVASAYTVNLGWTAITAPDLGKYTVYNAVTKAVLATVLPPASTASVSGLNAPTSFYLTASNNSGVESTPSSTVSITTAMTNIRASMIGTNLVFTWDAVSGVAYYNIYSIIGTVSTKVLTVNAPAITGTVPSAKVGDMYWLTANGNGINTMPSNIYVVPNPVTDLNVNSVTIGP